MGWVIDVIRVKEYWCHCVHRIPRDAVKAVVWLWDDSSGIWARKCFRLGFGGQLFCARIWGVLWTLLERETSETLPRLQCCTGAMLAIMHPALWWSGSSPLILQKWMVVYLPLKLGGDKITLGSCLEQLLARGKCSVPLLNCNYFGKCC